MLSRLLQRIRSHATIAPVLLLASLIQPPPASAIPAVSFESAGSGCGPSNLEGWEFQTTEALTVSAIGAFDFELDGLEHDIPVGIFDSTCTLVTSVIVPKGSGAPLVDQYRYVAIPPLVLPAGQTFRVAAVMSCNDFSAEPALGEFVLHPGITGVVSKRIGSENTLTCPNEMSSVFDFSANFIIAPPCGNGILQEGEQCDDGNSDDDDCCSNACTPQHAGDACAPDRETCTLDSCDATGVCEHPPGNAGSVCRPPEFDCDAAETCDGTHAECPEDDILPDQSPCTDDGLFCTGAETCFEGVCSSAGDPCDSTCDENADQCVPFTPTATTVPTASATPTVTATRTAAPAATATLIATATHTATTVATALQTATATVPPTPPTATATGEPMGTPVATETSALPAATITGSPIRTPVPTDTATAVPTSSSECRGDCDGDGMVAINELITAVTIALGSQPLSLCPSLDSSANGAVEINELIAAVADDLNGCG